MLAYVEFEWGELQLSLDLPQNASASRVKSPKHVVDFWIPSKTLGIVHHLLQAPGHHFGQVRAQMVVQACIGCMKLKRHNSSSSHLIDYYRPRMPTNTMSIDN
jgi:hypothetical protein